MPQAIAPCKFAKSTPAIALVKNLRRNEQFVHLPCAPIKYPPNYL